MTLTLELSDAELALLRQWRNRIKIEATAEADRLIALLDRLLAEARAPDKASAFPACHSYEQLRAELSKLPMTWYPDLIRAMVVAAYQHGVFIEKGASVLVGNVEKKLAEAREPSP